MWCGLVCLSEPNEVKASEGSPAALCEAQAHMENKTEQFAMKMLLMNQM